MRDHTITFRDMLNYLGNIIITNLAGCIAAYNLPAMVLPLFGIPNVQQDIMTLDGIITLISYITVYYICFTILMFFMMKKIPSTIYEETDAPYGWLKQFLHLAIPAEVFMLIFNTIPWNVALRFGQILSIPAYFLFLLLYLKPSGRDIALMEGAYIPMDFVAYILCHMVHMLICLCLAAYMYKIQLKRYEKAMGKQQELCQKSQYYKDHRF